MRPTPPTLLAAAILWLAGCGSATGPVVPPPPPPPTIVSVTVAPATISLASVGASGQFTAAVIGSTGPVTNPSVQWSSSNPAIVAVSGTSATATVTAVTPGTVQVTATSGGQSGTGTVIVAAPPPAIPTFDWFQLGGTPTHAVFGGGKWVAVGGPGGKAFTSPTGGRWKVSTVATTFTASGVVWTGTRYVVFGGGGAFASPDGVTWTRGTGIGQAPGPLTGKRSIVWTGAKLIASDAGNVFTSVDGLAWQAGTTPPGGASELVWTGSTLAANNGGGAGAIVVSADTGKTWSGPASLPADLQLSTLAWDGTRFVKWRGRNFGTSVGGLSWNEVATTISWPFSGTVGFNGPIDDVQWVGDRYLALGLRSLGGATLDGGALLSSPDGVSWRELDTGRHGLVRSIARSPAGTLVLGAASLFSSDHVNWAMRLFDYQGGQWPINWSVDRFLSIEPRTLLVSQDGVSWRRFSTPLTDAAAVAVWTGQLYVVASERGQIITSPDGIQWTTRQSGTTNNLRDLVFAGGRVVALGQAGTVTSSPDGIGWSAQSLAASQLTDLEWTGQRFVAVGGTTAFVSPDGATWQASSAAPSPIAKVLWTGTELVGFNNSRAVRSADGLTWTSLGDIDQTSSTLNVDTAIRLGNVFVACQTLSSALVYSSDGRTWRPAPTPEPLSSPCHHLGWNGSLLVVGMQFDLAAGTKVP